jgi:hypothetical protein
VAVLVPRIRTLGVRLSEEEYSALEMYSVKSGARSISDVARTAICDFIRRALEESSRATVANEQIAHVENLEQRVSQLIAEIALLRADTTPITVERSRDESRLTVEAPLNPNQEPNSSAGYSAESADGDCAEIQTPTTKREGSNA